jgi:DNA-binding NarL/FixJ family response regulator
MSSESTPKTIGLLDTQPATVEGMKAIVAGSASFRIRWSAGSLVLGLQLVRQDPVDLLVIDKTLGLQAVIDALASADALAARRPGIIVWGNSMSEQDALRLLQAGARGILSKTADVSTILACLRTVAGHGTWMEGCVFKDSCREERFGRNDLTSRERQVLLLVERGLKNKEIAQELGIRPGTVKIHLKHIFEKTGVRGRYGLAISGFRNKGEFGAGTAPANAA